MWIERYKEYGNGTPTFARGHTYYKNQIEKYSELMCSLLPFGNMIL